MMRRLLMILLAMAMVACSDDGARGGGGGDPGGGGGGGEEPLDAGLGPDAAEEEQEQASLIPSIEQPFQVVFYRPKEAIGEEGPKTDLFVVNEPITAENAGFWKERRQQPDLRNLTGHPETGESVMPCASCTVSADGTHLAWAEVDPGTGDAQLYVAPIEAGWQIRYDLRRLAAGTSDDGRLSSEAGLGFAGEWLVYAHTSGDRSVVKAQQATNGSNDHVVQELPAGGGFVADPTGSVIVTYRVESLASMTAFASSPSGGGDPLQLHLFEVTGASTGSDYTGREKGAVSPDGQRVAILTQARERLGNPADFRLHILSTNPSDPGAGHLSSVRLGPTGQNACTTPREGNEYIDSDQPPIWSPDGGYVYVLARARAHCGNNYSVDDTAVMRFEVLANGEIGAVANLTPNRADYDHPRRAAISQMALSPDGTSFILAATPHDRVRGTDLFLMSARANEVYADLVVENPDETLFSVLIRLTRGSSYQSRNPITFPLR